MKIHFSIENWMGKRVVTLTIRLIKEMYGRRYSVEIKPKVIPTVIKERTHIYIIVKKRL